MSDEYYSTPAQVISYTGVNPKDLGLEDDDTNGLNTLLETWLEQIKSLIDADRNRNYAEEESIPKGIDNIALRIAANLVALAMIRRDTPIVRIDEFNIQLVRDEIFTEPIQKDLSRFPAKPRFRLMRVRTAAEIEEDEAEDEE